MCQWHVSENSEPVAKNCPTDNDAYGDLDKSNLKFIYGQFLTSIQAATRDMADKRRLPIGVQSFESLRNGNFVYVDKTRFIYELAHSSKQYFLSRPRRFGKSLFLSTLKAYWEGKRELFEGLAIVELEKDNSEAWEPYPVFCFDFNGQNYQGDSALEDMLSEHLKNWERIYGGDSNLPYPERFRKLLRAAKEQTSKDCVVLVDEYDKPLLKTYKKL